MVNIFTSMSFLKLEDEKKQAYQYCGTGDGNYCPDILEILDIDPADQVNHCRLFFTIVSLEMTVKGIQAHISKSSFQYLLLDEKHFQWTGSTVDQNWDGLD